jgi:3-phenylpropionate/trans-cinnamate dioxygenase ferredoxin subunit
MTGDRRDIGAPEDLADRRALRKTFDGHRILVVKADDRIFAIGNQCTHQGAPLDKGVVKIAGSQRTVTCPAHGSMFSLDDGRVMRPPATKPVPVYEVAVEDGRVFVRPRRRNLEALDRPGLHPRPEGGW